MGLDHCDVAVGLEEHYCDRSARLHVADDIFDEHIQPEMDIRYCVHDPDGNCPDDGDRECDDEGPLGKMRRPCADCCKGEADHDEEEDSYYLSGTGLYLRIIFMWLSSKAPWTARAWSQISSPWKRPTWTITAAIAAKERPYDNEKVVERNNGEYAYLLSARHHILDKELSTLYFASSSVNSGVRILDTLYCVALQYCHSCLNR